MIPLAFYEFKDPTGQSDTRIFLGWSGVSYRGTGMDFYYSSQLISGMEPDASSGLHHIETVGIVKHIETLRDCSLLKQPGGYTFHSDAAGDVTVAVERKLGLFEKLIVTVNGIAFRGSEILKKPF